MVVVIIDLRVNDVVKVLPILRELRKSKTGKSGRNHKHKSICLENWYLSCWKSPGLRYTAIYHMRLRHI